MRLINVESLKLKSFTDDYEAPRYIILSHCWGEDEVTLQDVLTKREHELERKLGWMKIVKFCEEIRESQHMIDIDCHWAWVDTCCIDKTSSAELSEAINSMFRWYERAVSCYVWLEDVEGIGEDGELTPSSDFEKSRWFTRGWTLQELLAPHDVYFFDKSWRILGHKRDLSQRIQAITKIHMEALTEGEYELFNVAQRMSWAADRKTTRREDLAYCLMGLFDVNMPLLYGEGDKAFIRLQEEIMKASDDQSILAWNFPDGVELLVERKLRGIGGLAIHPSCFSGGSSIELLPSNDPPISVTTQGLQISAPVIDLQVVASEREKHRETSVVVLSCRFINDVNSRVGLPVHHLSNMLGQATHFVRNWTPLVKVPYRGPIMRKAQPIYLVATDKVRYRGQVHPWRCLLQYPSLGTGVKVACANPQEYWAQSLTPSCTMLRPTDQEWPIVTTVGLCYSKVPGQIIYVVMSLHPDDDTRCFTGMTMLQYIDADTARSVAQDLTEKGRHGAFEKSEDKLPTELTIDNGSDEKKILYSQMFIRRDKVFEVAISSASGHRNRPR